MTKIITISFWSPIWTSLITNRILKFKKKCVTSNQVVGKRSPTRTTQVTAKAICCCSHIDAKVLLLKTTDTKFLEHGEAELVPT